MIPRLWVLLGRLGDICSILPLLLEESHTQRPALMVSKEYAHLLEGVSYCDCLPFEGDYNELDRALEYARTLAKEVKCLQVAGPPDAVKRCTYEPANASQAVTDSFVKEAWKFAGKLDRWKDGLPLTFDRRNPDREAKLCELLPKQVGPPRNRKKTILVALGGTTSPFPYTALCFELLRLKFPKFHLLDISQFKAENFYDLLGLYERAHCLVACDSAPLHLAYATPALPTVALVNDQPSLWHGSPWRANHIAHIRYGDFPFRASEMLNAIEHIGAPGCPFNPDLKSPRLIHVWSAYEITAENQDRTLKAGAAWEQLCDRVIQCPAEVGALGQDTVTVLKDDKRYPLLKDVVRLACLRAQDDDIICLTRCDTIPSKGLDEALLDNPIAYSHRTLTEDTGSTFHPAVDLFAFTKGWWDAHVKECPPLIMGQDTYWYRVLLDLFKKHGAKELPWAVHRAPGAPLPALPSPPKRLVHNETLATQFWQANPSLIEPPSVIAQTSLGWTVNRHALNSYGYNPSLIRFNERLLMAYRWHPEHESQTRLALAEFDPQFGVKNNKEIRVSARSAEDPRLFTYAHALWICFVDSTWPDTNPKCVTKYGRLREYEDHWAIEEIWQPLIGQNDGTALEKNWVFWEHDGKLLCLYQTHGEQIIHALVGDKSAAVIRKPGPRWPYGPIRGGTSPLPFKGKYLRFFHSGLDNEPSPWRRRYYTGAMLMEDPLTPLHNWPEKISKEPILRGSVRDDLTDMERSGCPQYKARVVFPCGAIEHEEGWLLSCGTNDASCALIKVTEKELKL